jgi:hypothetical protein
MEEVIEVASNRRNLSATGTIAGAASLVGVLVGPFVAGATLKVADAAGTIINTFSPSFAGQFIQMPVRVKGDVTITIAVAALDCTVLYQ